MSLVLAFGLSPLGQVPAYAGDEGLQTQAVSDLQPQAKSLDELLVEYGVNVPDPESTTEAPKPNLHTKGDILKNPTYTGSPQTVQFEIWATDGSDTHLLTDGTGFNSTLTFYETGKTPGKDKGVDVPQNGGNTPDGTYNITGAGTYVLTATGENVSGTGGTQFKGVTKEFTFTVARMDINDATVSPVNAAGGTISANWGLPYTGSDQVITAAATGASSDLADQIVSSKATANAVGPYTVEATPYGGDGNKNITGSKTVNFQVKQNSFLAGANAVAAVDSGSGTTAVKKGDVVHVEPTANSTTAYAKINGKAITADATHPTYAGHVGTYTAAAGATPASVTSGATVTVDKLSNPIEVTYGDTKLEENTEYTVAYKTYDAASVTSDKWTDVELSDLAKNAKVGDIFKAVVTVNNPAKFTETAGPSKAYTIDVFVTVDSSGTIEKLADSAVVAEATYLGGATLTVNNKDFTASFYKDGQPVSTIGKAWDVVAGSYGYASGATATTALLKSAALGPVAAGEYTLKLTGDGASYTASTGVDATFKVLPRVAKEAPSAESGSIGDLVITLNDQPYNDGNFVTMTEGTNYKVEMIIDKDGKTQPIEETYDAALGNKVRNWKVTWKDAKGNKVVGPAAMGDYTAEFEFSGNLEGTPTITKDFKVSAGNIADFVDGLSLDAGALDTGGSVSGGTVSPGTATALAYVSNPSMIYTGSGLDIDKDTITLVKKWTKDTDATHTKGRYYAVDKEVTDNCEYELTYTPRNETAKVDENGKPLTAGTYNVTAKFSGSYEGEVAGVLTVTPLDLSDVVLDSAEPAATQKAVVQYAQLDGSYDAVHSAAYTGSAIVPDVRIVAVDDKYYTDEPTVINPDSYTVTFSNNVNAGGAAKIKVVPAEGQGTNINYTTAAQDNAFKITDSSFDAIGASISLSKTSAKFGEGTGSKVSFDLQVKSTSAGALSYVGKNESGQITGNYNSSQDVYYNSPDWYKKGSTAAADKMTTTISSDLTNFKLTDSNAYSLRVLDPDGKNITASIKFALKDKAGTEPADAGKYPNYDDPTTITVSNFPTNKAGEYKVIANAATSKPLYGGRVVATFTVEGKNISDINQFGVSYQTTQKDAVTNLVNPVVLPYGADWDIDYDATKASSKYGIRLDDKKQATASNGTVASKLIVAENGTSVAYSGGWPTHTTTGDGILVESTDDGKTGDYTVEYEDNKAAGTAKVTIKGINDYTGELTRTFTINRAELTSAYVGVVYDDKIVTKDEQGALCTPYTGKNIEPNYEVVIYKDLAKTQPVSYLDKSEYSAQWWKNKNVSYANNSPKVESAAGIILDFTKNYKGSIDNQTFRIDPVDLYNNANVTIDAIDDLPESTEKVVPNVTVKLNGTALTQGTDYVVNTENDGKAGPYTAYIASGKQGNTTVSTPIPVQFNIKKADEITYDLAGATVALSASKFTYNGQVQAPTVGDITLANGTKLDKSLVNVSIPSPTNHGTYTVTVTGKDAAKVKNSATATFTIDKANNSLKIAKATRTFKGVSKKNVTKAGVKVKKASQTKVTYKKVSVKKGKKAAAKKLAKKITVNKTSGKITVKKGLKAGKYKVTVSAKAAATQNYNASALQKAVVTLKVKK